MKTQAHLVARPISSFVLTFLMIQFLQAAMRPSSWNHVSICTKSPLQSATYHSEHRTGMLPCTGEGVCAGFGNLTCKKGGENPRPHHLGYLFILICILVAAKIRCLSTMMGSVA